MSGSCQKGDLLFPEKSSWTGDYIKYGRYLLTYMKIMKMRMSGFDEGPLVGEISGSEAQLLCQHCHHVLELHPR